jgi:hypothetical protein
MGLANTLAGVAIPGVVGAINVLLITTFLPRNFMQVNA